MEVEIIAIWSPTTVINRITHNFIRRNYTIAVRILEIDFDAVVTECGIGVSKERTVIGIVITGKVSTYDRFAIARDIICRAQSRRKIVECNSRIIACKSKRTNQALESRHSRNCCRFIVPGLMIKSEPE